MVQVSEYPRIARSVVEHYAQFIPSAGEVDVEMVVDETRGHYELLHNGWANGYRIHGAVIHIDLKNDRFWIQHDGTERGVANDILEAGVPREHIVLAFQPPEMRRFTEFAVG